MARLDTPGEVVEIIGSVALNEPVVTSKQRTCKFGNEFHFFALFVKLVSDSAQE
jgi:hypothetical protein